MQLSLVRGKRVENLDRPKAGPLVPVSHVVNAKEKLLKEMKIRMVRRQNSLIANIEKVLAVWIEDETSHNVP